MLDPAYNKTLNHASMERRKMVALEIWILVISSELWRTSVADSDPGYSPFLAQESGMKSSRIRNTVEKKGSVH
jgi:hypothetical protein